MKRPNMVHRVCLVVALSALICCLSFAATKQDNPPPASQTVAGTIDRINTSRNSLSIRLGDATTTFSFDNKTVFNYGQHRSDSSDLRRGDQVLITAVKGKATQISATEQVQGVIEQVDAANKKLLVKVGDQTQEIPFDYFLPFGQEGKSASYADMKAGDAIVLNVNVGFAGKPASVRAEKP